MKIGIIGTGGHGKVVEDIALANGYEDLLFFDDDKNKIQKIKKKQYAGKISRISDYHDINFVIAIGDNLIREKFYRYLEINQKKIITLIHPTAYIGRNVNISKGVVVMANCVINSYSKISKGCIINTAATIDHDCKIGSFTHICPGVNIAGNVSIGKLSFIGIGSQIVQNINIRSNSIIGAGTTVLKNISSKKIFYKK